ncbi:hypothetical protein NX059_011577 [Plenodomus lindquistii]|nr:hypothetical protein NX059_011577 [Plenodomus lindquistii]
MASSSSAGQSSKGKRRADSPDVEYLWTTTKRHQTLFQLDTTLCLTCQMLNLDAKFDEARQFFKWMKTQPAVQTKEILRTADERNFYKDGFIVHHFLNRLSRSSDCPLCVFFASMRVQPDEHQQHKLLAFNTREHWLFNSKRIEFVEGQLNEYVDTVFMAVVPDIESLPPSGYEVTWLDYEIPEVGGIFHQGAHEVRPEDNNNLLNARVVEDAYDLEIARNWLHTCRTQHGDACKRRVAREPVTRGFRLIDCTKETPVVEEKPWGTPYVALSYVWGSTPADLVDWPKTILDAVEVTKQLGMIYIWVDRLCINQSDPDEKSYLIAKMTTIYEEADFTIVAAAGTGASHGLPGVLKTPRSPQPNYYLDSGSHLISILPDPRRELLNSPYWTRGWTYQEGVLSNRHLVFTPHQTYWECRCMAVQESAAHALFHNQNNVMCDFMLSGIFKSSAFSGGSHAHRDDFVIALDEPYRIDYGFPLTDCITLGAQLRGLNEHIREFSKRQLTNPTDSLHAFQGVIGMYATTPSLYLFHGIPMWTGDIPGTTASAQITFALSISSWYHGASLNHLMFVSTPCPRRTHLPSWTWAGWKGTVTWRAPPNLEHCAYMSDLIKAKATEPNLVWAASLYVAHSERQGAMRLMGARSVGILKTGVFDRIEVREAWVLNTFTRVEDTKREWSWQKRVGRPGREELKSRRRDEERYFRIGKRLAFIGMSIEISPEQWTARHVSGELVSVLMFVGRYCDNEHGTARFLTVRRVQGGEGRVWERVGTLYTVVPFVGRCRVVEELFGRVPATKGRESFVIQ